MTEVRVQVCWPKSKTHFRGFRWLSSLTHTVVDSGYSNVKQRPGLRHSMHLYTIYAQTGDERYLSLCEDFLKLSLAA